MVVNFFSEILMLYERGERYWKRNAPEAREEFESIIALCEKQWRISRPLLEGDFWTPRNKHRIRQQ